MAVSALAAGSAAAAEETPETSAAAADTTASKQLDTVTVTAERRNVDQQKAPLSVSTVSAEELDQANINDVTGLNGEVPGLVVAKSGGAERVLSIRGIGSETPENTNTQPGVSLHVDGVYIFNSIAANAAFIDPAQVEVLRGPQGTMFGQGSTGGTINVVSKQPELDDFGGQVKVGGGNYGLSKSSASINLPAGDTFAVRVAVQQYRHDGYAKLTDVYGKYGYEADQADELGGKIAALWAPTDDFQATFSAIRYKSDTNAPAQKNILDPIDDARVISQDYPGKSLIDFELYSANLRWKLPWATFKSITAYQKLHSKQSWDADALTADLFWAETYSSLTYTGYNYDHVALWQSDVESWSQEFNLSSDGDGPLQWITGVVFLKSTNKQYILEYRDSDTQLIHPVIPASTAWDATTVASVAYADLEEYTRRSWAAYVQGTYSFTDSFRLTAGARYNKDRYSGEADNMSGGTSNWTSGAYLQPQTVQGYSTHNVTGKLALEYQFTPSSLGYLSYTRGYKPGGLNGSSTANGDAWETRPYFKPETVNAFELGSKNRFLDNTLQLNAAAFLYNYKNMQFLNEDPMLYGEGIANAPSARIYGLEFEGSWLATASWRFDASLSTARGKFNKDFYALDPAAASAAQDAAGYPGWLYWTNFYSAVLARAAAEQNINGNEVPKIPRIQGNLSATFSHQLGAGLFTAKAEFVHRGSYQYRLYNNSTDDKVPAYSVANLYFSYAPDDSHWDYSVSVTNLFDRDGVNSRFSDPYGSAQVTETYIAPRQWIFSVQYSF
ncbi:MAG: TonB-dependent receptor [Pseudoxanthomonas sp.]